MSAGECSRKIISIDSKTYDTNFHLDCLVMR